MKKTLMILFMGFAMLGCTATTTGGIGLADERGNAAIDSAEFAAFCAERAAKGMAFDVGAWAVNIATAIPAAALGKFAKSNPITANYDDKCAQLRNFGKKRSG